MGKDKKQKKRIDRIIHDRGIAPTRNKAQGMIMAGIVKADGKLVQKPGEKYTSDVNVEIIKPPHPYVGRGGLKLEKALDHFEIQVEDKVCIDAGSSTGGFTHCLLLRGAKRVYAVDVGYGQIDLSLRNHPGVILIERLNVRYLTEEQVPEKVDVITADLSFISLTKVMENLKSFLKKGGVFIPLIKPQFEAERKDVKKGIIRDEKVRKKAVKKIIDFAESIGFKNVGVVPSPITGASGNVEYLACFLNK